MKYLEWMICISILFVYSPAAGELFKYEDKEGPIRFTDDYSEVPKEKPVGIQLCAGSETVVDPNAAFSQSKKETPDGYTATEESPSDNGNTDVNLDEIRSGLDLKKQELLEEYQSLTDERSTLEEMRQSVDKNNLKQLNQRVADINEKIENYEKKLAAYNEEIKAYNAKVMEKNNRILKTPQNTP